MSGPFYPFGFDFGGFAVDSSFKALMWARSGMARSGATRSGYYNSVMPVTVNGVDVSLYVWRETCVIDKDNSDRSNRATLLFYNFTPTPGQRILIGDGAINNRIFGGIITLRRNPSNRKAALNLEWADCQDWTYLLNKYQVWGRYTSQAAHLIFLQLAALAAGDGFTTANVKTSSPTIDEITFTGEDLPVAFTRLANRATTSSAPWKWYPDPRQGLHFFDTETTQAPTPITVANLVYDNLEYSENANQIITRAYVVGGGGQATAPVLAAATSIPVDECSWYSATGGSLECGPQIVTYTGRSAASGPGNLTGVPAAGVGAVQYRIAQGDAVNLLVQVDDAAAQAAIAAIEGGNGIHGRRVSDGRWGLAEATQVGQSLIDQWKTRFAGAVYESPDLQIDIGKSVQITLPARGIAVTVPIQKVSMRRDGYQRWTRRATLSGAVRLELADAIRQVSS